MLPKKTASYGRYSTTPQQHRNGNTVVSPATTMRVIAQDAITDYNKTSFTICGIAQTP